MVVGWLIGQEEGMAGDVQQPRCGCGLDGSRVILRTAEQARFVLVFFNPRHKFMNRDGATLAGIRILLQSLNVFVFLLLLTVWSYFALHLFAGIMPESIPLLFRIVILSFYGFLVWQIRPFQRLRPSWHTIAEKLIAARIVGFLASALSALLYLLSSLAMAFLTVFYVVETHSVSIGRFRFFMLLFPVILLLCRPQRLARNLSAFQFVAKGVREICLFLVVDLRKHSLQKSVRVIRKSRVAALSVILLTTGAFTCFNLLASIIDYEMSLFDRSSRAEISAKSYYDNISDKVRGEISDLNWEPPRSPIEIDFQVDQVSSVDLLRNSISMNGKITAFYTDASVDNPYGKGPITRKATADPLSIASLNFVPGTENKFEPFSHGLVDGRRFSIYTYSGEFPLESKLENFPYDGYKWSIKLKMDIIAASLRLVPVNTEFMRAENTEMNGISFESAKCEEDEVASDKYVCATSYVAGYDEQSSRVIGWPVIEEYGFLVRDSSSAFFRYLFPVLVSILILTVVDLLGGDAVKELRLATPPTIFLSLAFMQSSYQALVRPSSFLTFLDQLYIASYVLCLIALAKAVLDYGSFRALARRGRLRLKELRLWLSEAYVAVFLIFPFLAWPVG